MKERPILFSAPMVRAIMEGRKTQTRRVVKPQPTFERVECYGDSWAWAKGKDNFSGVTTEQLTGPAGLLHETRCPFRKGNKLWVKETYGPCDGGFCYRASEAEGVKPEDGKWHPSIFMFREASRITLEITEVRVERLQEISARDCVEEGIDFKKHECECDTCARSTKLCPATSSSLIMEYSELWDSINRKKYPWAKNPWAWAITFKRV